MSFLLLGAGRQYHPYGDNPLGESKLFRIYGNRVRVRRSFCHSQTRLGVEDIPEGNDGPYNSRGFPLQSVLFLSKLPRS